MKFWRLIGLLGTTGIILLPWPVGALTISPVRVEIGADPGQTVAGEVLLINEQEGTRTFYSSFGNFEASGESGTPSFVEGTGGLASWIKTAPSVTLEQDEQREVPYTITVPANADPGGHFAAIFWSTVPPASSGGGVSLGARVGSLILLRVAGDIPEGGAVLEFTTKEGGIFFSSLPVDLTYRFQNGGGDRLKPEGEVKIKNLFGFTSTTLNANPKDGNVLPRSTRKFDVVWEKVRDDKTDEAEEATKGLWGGLKREWNNFAFGRYTARLDISFGTGSERANAKTSFFVLPWRLLIILVILLFVLLLGIKRYNRWIISKHTSVNT